MEPCFFTLGCYIWCHMFVCIFHNNCLCLLSLYIFIYVHLPPFWCLYLCVCVWPHFIFRLYSGSCLWLVCLYPPPPPPHSNLFQVRTLASAGGPDNLVMLDPGKYKARPRVPEPAGDGSSIHPKWQVGEQEFEALMRMLDNLVCIKKKEAFFITSAWKLMYITTFPVEWLYIILPKVVAVKKPRVY